VTETGVDSLVIEKVAELEESVVCKVKSPSLDKKREAVLRVTQLLAEDQMKCTLKILVPKSNCIK
jgi:hypothetical protein